MAATSPGPVMPLWKPCRSISTPTRRRRSSLPASSVDQFMDSSGARSVEQAAPVGDVVVGDQFDAEHVTRFALGWGDPAGHAREVEGAGMAFQVHRQLHLLAQGEGPLGLDLYAARGDVHGGAVVLGDGHVLTADVQLADHRPLLSAQTRMLAAVFGVRC